MDNNQPRLNLTDAHQTLGSLLRKVYEGLSEVVYGRLAESGYRDVKPAFSAVMRTISPDGSRIVDMALRAGITKQSMGDVVTNMSALGYVTVEQDPGDARARIVRLSKTGRELQKRALKISAEAEKELGAQIGAANVRLLRELLEKSRDALTEKT